jgi:phytoene synthase
MKPDAYCESRAAQSGSSFYYSFRLLPPDRRRAITAHNAYCRDVDDVDHEVSDAAVARLKLAWWRQEVASIFAGTPQHPAAQALAAAAQSHGLRQADLLTVIDGMEMDLAQNRYLDFAALEVYCDRVAGVVGRMSAQIFGYRNAATLTYARDLGIAFQLTNIVRDVGEDARRGRIYLPQDELARFGVTPASLLALAPTGDFRALLAFQVERANAWYDRALGVLPAEDRRTQRPGLAMAAIYRTLLQEIARDGYRVLDRRLALTPMRKLWIAWRTARRA